jgi:dUTPase
MEILGESDLLAAVKDGTFIKDGTKESCEGIKYDFILSNMALTVDSGRPRDLEQSAENAVIKPGEIAFVMTKETLDLPDNIYCQLSTKRKLSLDGIVILGGLIIDPNYKGKLIFGLYNLSSRNYPLLPGRKLVAGVFYKVDKSADKLPEPINNFPDELIKAVVDTKPNSISAVNTAIEGIRTELQEIKRRLETDIKWKDEFQAGLTDITKLVKSMGEKLEIEIDTRKNENLELKKEQLGLKEMVMPLSKIQKRNQFFMGVLVTLGVGVITGIIVFVVSRFL